MKSKKKVLVTLLCAALLVFASVMGTLAYLKSTTDVANNTFSVGNVQLTLDEAKVDVYGEPIEGANRVLGNEYKLIPGHEYVKDPTVTVKGGSEESYIRMMVEITDFQDVKKVFGNDFLPQYFVTGWDPELWISTGNVVVTNDTAVYEFWYKDTVNTLGADDKVLEPLFETIVVPDDVENEAIALLDDMEINVVAHAIQADGFDDAADAWAEF